MASGYAAASEGQGEVKEGFMCPLCMKNLESFYLLQDHYEGEHSGLVQKNSKKARTKLLRQDGETHAEGGGGATRSHMDDFKKYRAARTNYYINDYKLIIRLQKLTSFDRTNTKAAKIRAIEKSVVSWVNDSDVPLCLDCGSRFNVCNRRHHCRLCGSIMCVKCMEFMPLSLAHKLTSRTQEALCVPSSLDKSQSPPADGSKHSQHRSISPSRFSSVREEEKERIRCCRPCMHALLKKLEKLEERGHVPNIVKLYEKLRILMEKVEQKALEYMQIAESLNSGETTYNLQYAEGLQKEVQKHYKLIDDLSKKILILGVDDDPFPHLKTLQLQRMIRYSATLFLKRKLRGLRSLPTKEKYKELKAERKQELQKKLQQEKQAALEAQKKRSELEKSWSIACTNRETMQLVKPTMTKFGSWVSPSCTLHTKNIQDPLLEQIDNIQSCIKQGHAAQQEDEVVTLEKNLQQLQDEYENQQAILAIELSRSVEDAQAAWDWEEQQEDAEGHMETSRTKISPLSIQPISLSKPQFMKDFHPLPIHNMAPPQQPHQDAEPPPQTAQPSSMVVASLNSLEEDDSSLLDPSNPFAEDIQKERSQKDVSNGKKEYNPFDDEEEVEPATGLAVPRGGLNPFDEDDDKDSDIKSTVPTVHSGASTNPFDTSTLDEGLITEELLFQQSTTSVSTFSTPS